MLELETNSAIMSSCGCALLLFSTSMPSQKLIQVLFYIAGLVLVIISLSLYREEKDIVTSQISITIKQNQLRENQPDINEPCILASFGGLAILLGIWLSASKSEETEWMAAIFFILGWISQGFAASMATNSISSVQNDRLAYTLSGVCLIIFGSIIFHFIKACPALILATVGAVLFTVGNAQVVSSIK